MYYKSLYSTLIGGEISLTDKEIINDMFLKIDIINFKIQIINFFLNNGKINIQEYYNYLESKSIDPEKKKYLDFFIEILNDKKNTKTKLIEELKQQELELNQIKNMLDSEFQKINNINDELQKKKEENLNAFETMKNNVDKTIDSETKNQEEINQINMKFENYKKIIAEDVININKKLETNQKKQKILKEKLTNIENNLKELNKIKQKLEDDIFNDIKISFKNIIENIKSIKNLQERDNFMDEIKLLLDRIASDNNTFVKYKDNISTIKKKLNYILNIISNIHFAS